MASKEKKSSKPKIGNKKPSEVKEKKKRQVKKVEPPPVILPYLDGTVNPLLESKRNKRALCVALANHTADDEVLCEAVRQSGIVQKAGVNGGKLETDLLTNNELSGRGYALRTGRAMQKEYTEEHPEKVAACDEFAKKLIKAIAGKKIESARTAGAKEWEANKADFVKNQEAKAKKAAENKKAGKPSKSKKKGSKPTLKAKKEDKKEEQAAG